MEAIEVTLKEELSEFRTQQVGKLSVSHVPTAAPIDKEVFKESEQDRMNAIVKSKAEKATVAALALKKEQDRSSHHGYQESKSTGTSREV